jgi:hypothetical protein
MIEEILRILVCLSGVTKEKKKGGISVQVISKKVDELRGPHGVKYEQRRYERVTQRG